MKPNTPKNNRFSRSEILLLVLLFGASFVIATGIQMGTALFPGLAKLMDVPIGRITLLTSVWAFTGLLSPIFGPLSDRYGHKLFLAIGIGVFTLGNVLSALAPNFYMLMACQTLVGLGYAIFGFTGFALLGDIFRYETRARAIGIVRFAVSAACLLGVPVASTLASWGTARVSFGAVGGLSLMTLLLFLYYLPRVNPMKEKEVVEAQPMSIWRGAIDVLRKSPALKAVLTVMVWAMLPTGTFIYLAAWLQERFQLMEAQIGLAFSLIGVGSLIGNALAAAFTDRIGKKRSTLIGLITLSLTLILLALSPNLILALVGVVIFVIGLDFGFTSFGTLVTEIAPESRGTLMSLVSLANGIGTGLTPLLLAPIWESGGYRLITSSLGIMGLCTAVFFGWLIKDQRSKDQPGSPEIATKV